MSMDKQIAKKKLTPRRIAWMAGAALLVILLIYGLTSVGGSSTLRVDADKLTVSEVVRGEFQEFITVPGEVMPIGTFYLDASQGGQVVNVFAEEGTFVSVGDRILQLDNTDLHLDIMYREAQLFEQINNLRNTRLAIEQNSLRLRGELLDMNYNIQNAEREYKQAIELREKNLNSQNEFSQKKDEYDYWLKKKDLTLETQRQDSILRAIQVQQLEASVSRMQANQEVVKQKLENLVIKAPVAGHLTSLNAEVGESKSRGQRLGKIDILEGFKIRAGVDEYYISRIAVGQRAVVKIGGREHRLTIEKVYPEVINGKFEIDMEFENTEPQGIRRGQTVQARLVLGDLSSAVMVSKGGFYSATGGRWVYVLDESGETATKRDITIGRMNPHVYEVLDGLAPGDKVITSSYDTFKEYERLVLK
jgi:HlyD family secretion protein